MNSFIAPQNGFGISSMLSFMEINCIMVMIQPGAAGRRCHWRVRGGEVSPAKPGGRSSLSIFVLPLQRMFMRMMNVANMRICMAIDPQPLPSSIECIPKLVGIV